MISIQNQLVGALEGSKVTLECLSEAYPRSINYWTKENGEIVPQGMWEVLRGQSLFILHKKKKRVIY